MSNEVNTRLLERASECIDYWSGTLHAKLIEQAIDQNDLEYLAVLVKVAEEAMLEAEYQPDPEPLTDEQIEKLATDAFSGREYEDVF